MLGPYGALLRVQGAFSFSSMGFLARMPISMTGLGAVLLVSAETGRYGIAGITAGVLSLSFALVSPLVARLVDRFGQASVLRPAVIVYALAGVGFVVAVELGTPVWTWLVLAALTGASGPNIGSMVRARWAGVLDDPVQRQTAFAFESVVDEVVFVTGPPLVTFLATAVSPPVGFLTAIILGLVGGLGLATLTSTEPRVPDAADVGAGSRALLEPGLLDGGPHVRRGRHRLRRDGRGRGGLRRRGGQDRPVRRGARGLRRRQPGRRPGLRRRALEARSRRTFRHHLLRLRRSRASASCWSTPCSSSPCWCSSRGSPSPRCWCPACRWWSRASRGPRSPRAWPGRRPPSPSASPSAPRSAASAVDAVGAQDSFVVQTVAAGTSAVVAVLGYLVLRTRRPVDRSRRTGTDPA